MQEQYQKSSENLNLFLVFQVNLKKIHEPFSKLLNMLLSQSYDGKFHRVVVSVATALDLLFGGFTTTQKFQYQRKKLDLCGYHHPTYFAKSVPENGCIFKDFQPKLIISIRILLLY